MITQRQIRLVYDLANDRISAETFVREFGAAEPRDKIAPAILETALIEKNAADVAHGLAVGFKLGFSAEYTKLLSNLFELDWHCSHEDIISALDELRDSELVDLFYKATRVIPPYLDFDENRALAVKAIWALGNLGTDKARTKLKEISQSEHPRLKAVALEQLRR